MPHHPKKNTAPASFQEGGPVTSFLLDPFLSLPSDRFSSSYTDFLLEENSNRTVADPMFKEGLQSEQIRFYASDNCHLRK